MDFTYIEAFLRNLVYRFGQETGLPVTGREDWAVAAAAVAIVVALVVWSWPIRRAFRIGGPLRWLVAALALAALIFWLWPLWVFALILSGIRRSPKPDVQAKPAPANPIPALLAEALKTLTRTAQQRSAGGGKPTLGPWGKQARPASAPLAKPGARPAAVPKPVAVPTVARGGATLGMPAAKPAVTVGSARRGSLLPNRETWIKRRG